MKTRHRRSLLNRLFIGSCIAVLSIARGWTAPAGIDSFNVVWTSPGADSRDSMPLGNGDIGLNVWVEKEGDLLFYISKTDAWTDHVPGDYGLAKVGRVRVHLDPNPFAGGAPFSQALILRNGEIQIEAGQPKTAISLRLWVDANRPVIHLEGKSAADFQATASFETLRPVAVKNLQADSVLDAGKNRVAWVYRNLNTRVPQLTNLTFGAEMKGEGLVSTGTTTLQSAKPGRTLHLAIYPLTLQTGSDAEWLAEVDKQIANDSDLESARAKHQAWWQAFWNRSWLFASGDDDAKKVSQGYNLQRFISACAGRGAYPIKFNGSIFTMDYKVKRKVDGVYQESMNSPDCRAWGGQCWFQNTRAMYWPMLAEGDFDMMQPLFRMFQAMLPDNTKAVRDFYKHEGAYFCETKPFWGGINLLTAESKGGFTQHYYTPILELSAMMLDYFAFTCDRDFVTKTLLPVADAGLKFFDQHWKRDPKGKLFLDNDNAIEMFWKATNPAPDIAGLRWVLAGMLALPSDLTTPEQRQRWQRFQGEIPELPVAETAGVKLLLPAEVFDKGHNSENPELYSIYPFRLFGLGKPDLELARATFAARHFKTNGCWCQDGIQAALLGDTETARKNVTFVLERQDKQLRFPAFWEGGHDYAPDEDNGGNGLHALQLMLMQCEGRKITLMPAWPKGWDVDFKLNAPMNTIVEGRVRGGKVENLKVTPESRRADVQMIQ